MQWFLIYYSPRECTAEKHLIQGQNASKCYLHKTNKILGLLCSKHMTAFQADCHRLTFVCLFTYKHRGFWPLLSVVMHSRTILIQLVQSANVSIFFIFLYLFFLYPTIPNFYISFSLSFYEEDNRLKSIKFSESSRMTDNINQFPNLPSRI